MAQKRNITAVDQTIEERLNSQVNGAVGFQVVDPGNPVCTFVVEATIDEVDEADTVWQQVTFRRMSDNTDVTSLNAADVGFVEAPGMGRVRIRCSVFGVASVGAKVALSARQG